MTRFEITLTKKGLQAAQVDKLIDAFKVKWGEGVAITVTKFEPAESRTARLEEALSGLESAKEEAAAQVEELQEEMQSWLDNLEGANMEGVPKHDEVQECVDALEELHGEIESIDVPSADVNFPGMY